MMPHECRIDPDGDSRLLNALLRCFLEASAVLPDAVSDGLLRETTALAVRQGVIRHVLRALDCCASDTSWHEDLRIALGPACQRHLAAAVKVCEDGAGVLRTLAGVGITCVPYKGTFLSEDLYGYPCFRRPGDIDLIVKDTDLDGVSEALATLGYAADFPSPLIEEYYRVENNAIHLVCPGKATVDLHYAPHHDLPPQAHGQIIARARPVPDGAPVRLRPDPVDQLMLLAVNYWATDRWEHIHPLIDIAVLLKETGELPEGWVSVVESWGLSFHIACVIEGVRAEFGLAGLDAPLASLRPALSKKELSVCERVSKWGPGALPHGLVPKVHRLGLPLSRRLGLVRRFLWPHPGFVAHEMGKRRPDFFDRVAFAGMRLRRALRTR